VNKLTVPVNERDHVIGNPDAPVTVVQYGDYELLNCRKTHRATEKMIRFSHKKVRLVYRHFPLVHVHAHALRAAEAAEAAAAQGKFWEMHNLLYKNPTRLKDVDLRQYARKIGLDLEKFNREMNDGRYAEQILKNRDRSVINGISGAPTFFVNDQLWAMTGADLLAAVRHLAERSAARATRIDPDPRRDYSANSH
jgi:formate-nitrite transporter family protein